MSDNRPDPAIQATAQLYHDWLTGLILHLIAHRGTADASRFVRQLFRTKHLEQFLPGLRKLGLDGLPDAVACAQYHYLSNALGGVKVEYHQESDRKAWVRYPPPRWIWQGVAIAGIPTEVSAAMMWGWHAHNGVSLGNPRLGFVCTKQTVDGQPGLEGYYLEGDDELAPEERLRFAPDEEMPRFEPDRAPGTAAAEWPEERLAKAYRNYASDYMATSLGVLEDLFGPQDARDCAGRSARAVAMHWLDGAQEVLGSTGQAPRDFAVFLERIAFGPRRQPRVVRRRWPARARVAWVALDAPSRPRPVDRFRGVERAVGRCTVSVRPLPSVGNTRGAAYA